MRNVRRAESGTEGPVSRPWSTRACQNRSGVGCCSRPTYREKLTTPHDNRSAVDVLLVCSTGGHLLQLHALRAAWSGTSHAWITFDKSDARSLLAAEQVFLAFGPTNRNVGNLLRNLKLALRLIRQLRPRVVVTTGAGVAVPFCWVARLHGAKVVYVESLSRIEGPSLSCRMIAPVATRIYAQWPELAQAYGRARYVGSVFSRG